MVRFLSRVVFLRFLTVCFFASFSIAAAEEFEYEGHKKCGGCHKSEFKSWEQTAHGKALTSLKAGEKTEAKIKAKIDPDKDYSEDKECVGCHVTGFGHEGGYEIDDPGMYLVGVGCESCHGPGLDYRLVHRKAGINFENDGTTTPRQELVETGEEFDFIERCKGCHLNYAGSGWPGAKEPYTPFTPKVDPRYAFDFEKAVRDDKAMHAHFKLEGTFTGPPTPPFHKEFQAAAKPISEE